MSSKIVELLLKVKDKASGPLKNVGGAMAKLGTLAGGVATGGLALAGAAIVGLGVGAAVAGKAIYDMAQEAAEVKDTANTFDRLAESMGGSEQMTQDLREATRGLVSDADLWAASNKFVSMGISETAEGTAYMAEMATQLGMAMGEKAGPSMEHFALMMANQSIPRLDSFGISSSAVRDRIAELTEGVDGLSKEAAFNQAVMEQGGAAMERLGEQAGTGADRWAASVDNLTLRVGQAFLPVMEKMQDTVQPLIEEYGPQVIAWAEVAADWLGNKLVKAIDDVTSWTEDLMAGFGKYSDDIGPAFKEGIEVVTDAIGLLTGEIGGADVSARDIGEFLAKSLIGIITGVSTVVATLIKGVYFAKTSFGQLKEIGGLLADKLSGAVSQGLERVTELSEKLREKLRVVRDIVGGVKDKFSSFRDSLGGLIDKLRSMRDWIRNVGNSLGELGLPSWLIPGSPTPFELGLRGIGSAIQALPPLDFGVGAMPLGGGAGASSNVIHVTFGRDSVRSDDDIRNIMQQMQELLELQGIRGQIA